MRLIDSLYCRTRQSDCRCWHVWLMPVHITPCAQIPTVEIPEPVFVAVSFESSISFDHTPDGNYLRHTPFQNYRIVELYRLTHRCALVVAAYKRHAVPNETISIVSPLRTRSDLPHPHIVSRGKD